MGNPGIKEAECCIYTRQSVQVETFCISCLARIYLVYLYSRPGLEFQSPKDLSPLVAPFQALFGATPSITFLESSFARYLRCT